MPDIQNISTPPKVTPLLPEPLGSKRIAHVVMLSLTAFAILLFSISGLAIFGLQRLQSSLTDMAENSLSSVISLSANSRQISQLVALSESLIHVDNEAEQRIIYGAIERQLVQLSRVEHTGVNLPHLNAIKQYLEELNGLITQSIIAKKHVISTAQKLTKTMHNITTFPDDYETGLSAKQHALLHLISNQLRHVLETNRDKVVLDRTTKPYQLRLEIKTELQSIRNMLPSVQSSYTAFTILRQYVNVSEHLLLSDEGLLSAMAALVQIKSKIVSVNSLAHSIITDSSNSQITLFNNLIANADDTVKKTAHDLRLFEQILAYLIIVSILLALTVFIYFHKSIILRLETLNTAVLERVNGKQSIIDTSGGDEIATIARSVDYFATELGISKDLAEASSKAKSEFLANMSHEIRTPMNAIIGFTRMTLETKLSDVQKSYIEKISSSASFLLNIINDILDFSKIEAGKLDVEYIPFELQSTLDNIMSIVQTKAQSKNISVSVVVDANVPAVIIGDQIRLLQILNNLIDNAIKFTKQGKVTLAVTCVQKEAEVATIKFCVTDQGIGLTPEQVGKLFQAFTQADTSTTRKFGGTGLGLTICKRLCEIMGGTIGVNSVYGEGSEFYFTLPFKYTNQLHLTPEKEITTTQTHLDGKRILLVEDNEINQEIAIALLEKTGVTIDIANNGIEALNKIQNNVYHLVFMDIQMPEMDGITATEHIRAMADPTINSLPIIAMTAHAMDSDKAKSLQAGMTDHVSKPLEPELLFAALHKWIR